MAIMKCPDMKQLTPVCTKISVPDIERNCRKEIENLSNRFVETRGGRCSGAHPTYFPKQWDHCLCKHSLHFKQKLRWTVDLTHSARFPCPFWKKKKGQWEKPLLPLSTSGGSSGARAWFQLIRLLATFHQWVLEVVHRQLFLDLLAWHNRGTA